MVISLIAIMPLFVFLFIFIVSYALFSKTKVLGGSEVTNVLVSFLISVMFMFNPAATKFTLATIPWVAVLLVVLLFILVVLVFVRGNVEDLVKSQVVALILVAAVMIVFLAASVNVFGPLFNAITTGNLEAVEGTAASFIFNPALLGAVVLLIIAGATYWFLTAKG